MKKLLVEGPVGHMYHPFDLDQVQNGRDLLGVFQKEVIDYINKFTPSIKIDGINGPIRLITKEDGEKEFAIDRLSTAPLDVRGVTSDRLRERFEKAILQALDTDEEITIPLHKLVAMGLNIDDIEIGKTLTITHRKKNKKVVVKRITTGHGFVNDGTVALNLCNAALRAAPVEMQRVLEVLDMWDNPEICLNNDIVHESSKESGMVNAVKYDEDFIAFHGLNQIYIPEGRKARNTREIRLDDDKKQALNDFVALLNANNPIEGFRALSPYDTVALRGEVEIDYSPALATVVEIKLDDSTSEAKTIGEWLGDSKIFKPEYGKKFNFPEVEGVKSGERQYIFADGRVRDFFSKENYVALIPDSGETQYSVRDLLSTEAHPNLTEDDFYRFASGAIFYHATRLLGRQVLATLVNKSKVGNEELTAHEGVVMRSMEIFGIDDPVKITGDFIRSGMMGGIKKAMVKESTKYPDNLPPEIGDEEEERVEVTTEGVKTVAIMPGSFKPPHLGHLQMAEHLANIADEVMIFVSAPQKGKRLLPFSGAEVTYEKAIRLWKLLLTGASGNITLVESTSPSPSPITALEQLLKPAEERLAYRDIVFYPEDYAKFYLGMSEKEREDEGSMQRFSLYEDVPKVEVKFVPAFGHSPQYAEALSQVVIQNRDVIQALERDIDAKGLELASSLVSPTARKKLPANPTVTDYINALSKVNRRKVAKFMKSTPNNLDKTSFSATDLRLLMDLKKVYNLPVEELLKDFVGQNVSEYLRIVYGTEEVRESITVIQDMVKSILAEQLEEASVMGVAAPSVGVHGHMGGGSKPDDDEDSEDDVNEAKYHPSDLPIQSPRAASFMTVRVIPYSRHATDGNTSDAGFKKSVKNRFKIDSTYTDKRAPYYDEGDVITDLVEKVLRNIIRSN